MVYPRLKTYGLFLVVITIILYSCNSAKKIVPTNNTVLRIHVPLNKDEHKLPLSAVADSLHYIPLETRDDALIGQIDKLIPLNDRMIIVDKEKSQSIYLYDLQGHLLHKIKRQGRSGKEYISLTDIAVDPEGKRIFIWDSQGQKILIYTFDGTFITTIPFPYSVHSIAYAGDSTIVGYCGYTPNAQFSKHSQYPNLLFWNFHSGQIHPACYFNEGLTADHVVGVINNFSVDDDGVVALIPMNDTIYQATGNKATPKYYIYFGDKQHQLLQQYKDNLNNSIDVHRSIEVFNNASPCLLMNFLATRNLIYMFFKKRQNYYYGFYYPKSKRFIEASTCYEEHLNGNRIPVTNDLDDITIPFMPIAADEANHFYYTIDPYLFDYFKETKDSTLRQLMARVSPNDNPIVVKVDMKAW